ncbi:MAG: formylmethanofuran dehydrogenase subunit E family protein [Desulfobacterales bacterium]|nr:formylmethanofuran dehydrogenase subunit E family protein [Desulfobacterales bacterium]
MDVDTPSFTICGRSPQEFLDAIENFHGWKAPGIVLGGFMVDWARELFGPDVEADAIVETTHCLPDAVQLFTPCTFGNGWLKVLDWDKFALSLYDRYSLSGYRVWLDLEKTRAVTDLYDWYMRRKPKKDLPLDVLLNAIFTARRSILSSRTIRMKQLYQRKKKGQIEICSGCGEAYPAAQGPRCTACQGEGYFE